MTTQTSGRFVLSVRRAGATGWGHMETFDFDDNSSRKAERREAVLDAVFARRDGWIEKARHMFGDASFRIEEQPSSSYRGSLRGLALLTGPAYTDLEQWERRAA